MNFNTVYQPFHLFGFNSQSHHAVWKSQSDADNALCVNVLQAKDALSQTLSEKDPVYHYLKGSCRDEFDVSNLKSSCRTFYECAHLYCMCLCFIYCTRQMFSVMLMKKLEHKPTVFRVDALRKLPGNTLLMSSRKVQDNCLYNSMTAEKH